MISKLSNKRRQSSSFTPYHEQAMSINNNARKNDGPQFEYFQISVGASRILRHLGVLCNEGVDERKLLDCVIKCCGKPKTRDARLRMDRLWQTQGLKPEDSGVDWKFHDGLLKFLVNRDQYALYSNECRMQEDNPPIWKDSACDFLVPSKCQKHGITSHSQQDFVNADFPIPEGSNYYCSIATGEAPSPYPHLPTPSPLPGPFPLGEHFPPLGPPSPLGTPYHPLIPDDHLCLVGDNQLLGLEQLGKEDTQKNPINPPVPLPDGDWVEQCLALLDNYSS